MKRSVDRTLKGLKILGELRLTILEKPVKTDYLVGFIHSLAGHAMVVSTVIKIVLADDM